MVPTVQVGNRARQLAGDGGYIYKPGHIFVGSNPWKSVQIGPRKETWKTLRMI